MTMDPVDLHYYTIGSGFPLVLLHGWSADGLSYALQIPLAYRYRLILPDLRGHGRSPKPKTPCHPTMLAADVNRLLEKLGIEKAIIGGGSFGGLVALQFILDYPQKVEALILSDTTSNSAVIMPFMDMMLPVLSGPNPVETLKNMISKLAKVSGMTKTPVGAMMMESSLERFSDIDPLSLLEVSKGMIDIDFTQKLSEIKVPALIIGGKKDMVIPFKYTELLHQGISGSECVIIKTDHGTPFFRPDEWNRAVQMFLQRIGH